MVTTTTQLALGEIERTLQLETVVAKAPKAGPGRGKKAEREKTQGKTPSDDRNVFSGDAQGHSKTAALRAITRAPEADQPITAIGSKPDRSRLGRRSRRKGKVWERALAALLRPIFGEHVARGFQSRSGRDGCDVEGTPFWLEAKHSRCVNARSALKQALEATDGRPVVVIAKDNRSEPFVVMRLTDWLALAGRAGAHLPTTGDPKP